MACRVIQVWCPDPYVWVTVLQFLIEKFDMPNIAMFTSSVEL